MRLLLCGLLLSGCTAPPPGSFTNSHGMNFVRVPGVVPLVCTHETRVRDYRRFVQETGTDWPEVDFHQTGDHPAVNVSWRDAQAFCSWLGRKEGRRYRLPTDAEWSVIVGIRDLEPRGIAPQAQPMLPGWHPWGRRPLFHRAGNYCDAAFGREYGQGYEARWLPDYDDGHAATAPVGSFPPDKHGLHDLGGNVWEWCEDWHDAPKNTLKVLRGGSWRTGNPDRLLSSYRGPDPPGCRLDSAGFRLVIEP